MDMNPDQNFKEEIDFRDLLRVPRKLFGYSYIYFAVVILGLGVMYVSNLGVIGKNSIPSSVFADSSALVTDIPLQNARQVPPVDVLTAGVPSSELIAKGRDLFKANCASCHGDNGEGNGPAGLVLNPKPRNFHTLTGWTNGSRVSQIYRTLQEGIVRNGMASYGYLTPLERFALVHFVRTFATGHPLDSADDLKRLDSTYQLSRGMSIPGQIPIRKAAQIVSAETSPVAHEVAQAVSKARASQAEGKEIYLSVAADENRLFTTLYHNPHVLAAVDTLEVFIAANPAQAGFRAKAMRLTADEWSRLYGFLSGIH
jgi:mono/diheme cytochrome c family protein